MRTRNRFFQLTLLAITLSFSIVSQAAGLGTNIGVRLVGTGEAYDGNPLFDAFDLPSADAVCFDIDLVDIKTGSVIGTASDCLSDISGDPVNGLALTGTTFFNFPGGTLVTRGLTTVQPILHGSPDFTHITGAVPQPGDDNVIYGDGKFSDAGGTARLSGSVNLSQLDSDGLITFDCIFVLDVGRGD